MKKRTTLLTLFVIASLCIAWNSGNAIATENQTGHTLHIELQPDITLSVDEPIFYPVLQESLVDHFERATLPPWTLEGSYNWGIRDTADTYGPNDAAESGYRFAGIPQNDIAGYTGNQDGRLLSPTIDLAGWDSLYLAFNYWADLEGEASNFDGFIVEISPDNGTTWYQIDSLAEGDLNPTYDDECAGVTGQPLGTAWCYCYDTGEGDSIWWWVNVVSRDLIDQGYVNTGDQIKIRFFFGSDPASQGQGLFIDDVRITSYPPPDLQAPVIVHTPLSDTIDTVNAYTISADVTDEGAGLDPDSVYLYYKIEDGSWVPEQMIHSSGDTYEAAIPPQSWHTDIYYYIQAVDLASSPNTATTPTYSFEVTDARLILYDDGQPWWNPGDLLPGNGLFNNFSFSDVGLDSGILHKAIFYWRTAGPFDLHIYEYGAGWPGPLIDSLLGLYASGAGWRTTDLEPLGIHIVDNVLVGFISQVSGADSSRVLMDGLLDYPQVMWGWISGAWNQTPYTGGDFMIRLKVVPLPRPEPGVEENDGTLHDLAFGLESSVPNPMHSSTIIDFQIPTAQKVTLRIYNATGQLIKTLVDSYKDAGIHRVIWNGLDEQERVVPHGIYFYHLQGETDHATRKLVVTR
jgi:hypothetical protein